MTITCNKANRKDVNNSEQLIEMIQNIASHIKSFGNIDSDVLRLSINDVT